MFLVLRRCGCSCRLGRRLDCAGIAMQEPAIRPSSTISGGIELTGLVLIVHSEFLLNPVQKPAWWACKAAARSGVILANSSGFRSLGSLGGHSSLSERLLGWLGCYRCIWTLYVGNIGTSMTKLAISYPNSCDHKCIQFRNGLCSTQVRSIWALIRGCCRSVHLRPHLVIAHTEFLFYHYHYLRLVHPWVAKLNITAGTKLNSIE